MKNVLHLIDTFGTGGAETVFLQLIDRLDPGRYRSAAAVLGHGWLRNQVCARGLEPIDMRTQGSMDVKYLRSLVRLIRERHIDIVHTHLLTTALYGGIAGRITGVPVVSTFHGVNDLHGSMLALKGTIVSRCVSRVVFVSRFLQDAMVSRLPPLGARSTVIYNGVDCRRFAPRRSGKLREELGIAADGIVVGAVGRIVHAKGFDVLIRAAASLRPLYPSMRYVIVGEKLREDDTDRTLFELRRSLGLDDVVHILPFRDDIAELFGDFDIYALTSRTEGFSLTVVEAMASGLPVVATSSGGPLEIVEHGVDAIVVAPESADELVDAIGRLVADPGLRARMSVAARSKAEQKFALDATIASYQQLYDVL